LAFSVELAPDVLPTIETDSGRLRQVLKNLLANAFKFTASGEVSVRVSRAQNGWSKANDALRAGPVTAISISDTGIGILPELQRRIFEAFAQADGTTARQYGGTGLGLSISRELVRLLDGEITLRSTPDEGSTFTVFLPSRRVHGGVPSPAVPQAQQPLGRLVGGVSGVAGKKVLIVDDDFRNIFALTTLLERSELEVLSAESGAEGVALLQRTPDVDIVLVDIMMPVMDGYATIHAMHELRSCEDLPIVAVTANVAADTRRRCIEAGACAYVAKPVESADLLFVLSEWLIAAAPDADRAEVLR
jgi:two-component system chemotaxis sensor kinase CheA